MRIVEIKCNADIRVVAINLAHKIEQSAKCAIVTDEVAFARLGEAISKRVYRCDEIYVAVVPELFAARDLDTVHTLVDAAIGEIKEVTGDDTETCVLCWNNELETDYENKAIVNVFKTGMSTRDDTGYEWTNSDEDVVAEDTTKYVVFYDKKKYKSVNYEKTEKVLVTDAEVKAIREMEETGRFKAVSGGYSAITNDIAVKKCGVYGG